MLILSEDKSIFSPKSVAHQDILRCSENVDQLHVIIFTKKKDPYTFFKVSDKLFLYPTNSSSYFLSIWDVFNIVRSQIFWKFGIVVHLICARDSLRSVLVAYFLSRKYKRNYIIDILVNSFFLNNSKSVFTSNIKNKLFDFVFRKASAIRVISQDRGEIISARNPLLEKKIFILPPLDLQKNVNETGSEMDVRVDIHKKFKQFNIILLAVSQFLSIKDLKLAKHIMDELHLRYPQMGLVISFRINNIGWHPFFMRSLPKYIVMEEKTDTNVYYQNANIFIDIQSDNQDTKELIYAINTGSPVVVSKTPINTNIIRDGQNGFIVDIKKPNLFVRKVMDILETPGLREMMHIYRYDITDLYGTNPEDYYKRLITIWETYKTHEENMKTELPVMQTQPARIDFYPALTLDTVKKAFRKFEEDTKESLKKKERTTPTHVYEKNEIFDVDSVKLGIEKALEEIRLNGDFETEQKEDLIEIFK